MEKQADSAIQYERNVVYQSVLSGRFYFARKVKVLGPRTRLVVGRKVDITESLQPFLLKKFRVIR
jgi:hypothetical protein